MKVKDIQPVEATVPKSKYFPRLPGQSPQLIVHVNINRDDSFLKQLVQQVATSEARAEIYKQMGVEPTITKGTKGETSSEVMRQSQKNQGCWQAGCWVWPSKKRWQMKSMFHTKLGN